MARPQTNRVDYFPHPVTHGKKMSYLEKKYKNDGYATWMKILEELGNTEFHYLDLSDEVQMMFLSDRCLVPEDVLISIINDLIRLKEFDSELWNEHRILFNEKFIESIKDAYKKRSNKCINRNSLLTLLSSLGIRKPIKSDLKEPKNDLKGDVKPQSKVEYSKVKERESPRAYKIILENKQFEIESFAMQNPELFKNKNELKKLVLAFDDKMEIEVSQDKIEFKPEQLMPRFRGFARRWIENLKNESNTPLEDSYESGKNERF